MRNHKSKFEIPKEIHAHQARTISNRQGDKALSRAVGETNVDECGSQWLPGAISKHPERSPNGGYSVRLGGGLGPEHEAAKACVDNCRDLLWVAFCAGDLKVNARVLSFKPPAPNLHL